MPRDDGDEVEGRPVRPQKRKKKRKAPPRSVPVWAWVAVGIGALTLVVIGLVLVTRKGDRPIEPAARGDVQPAPEGPAGPKPWKPPVTVPAKNEPPKSVPPKAAPPRPEPPKLDPQGPAAEIDADWPVLPPRKRRNEPPDAPNRTLVRWYPAAAGAPPLIVLDVPTEPYPPRPGPHRGLLARELARQALSMSAREEFGAGTRDAVLREPPGDLAGRTPTRTFELAWVVYTGRSATATLSVVDGGAKRVAWHLDLPLAESTVLDYAALATALEVAARGSLADALAKETNAARVPARVSDARAPADVEVGLRAVNYFELLAAVRALHATIRSGGESPLLLTDLARGYATLGLLTEHLDVASHKSFKARGLLYAYRAVARKAPAAPWALAYTLCLVGLHRQALDQAKSAGANPPPWARVVEPACRFDHVALKALPGDEVGPIADVLRYTSASNDYTRVHPEGIGLELLQQHRDCLRVYDEVTLHSGNDRLALMTEESPRLLSNLIADRLGGLSELPAAAAAGLGKVRSGDAVAERTALRALDAAGGPGEPSLAALAALVRAERARQLDHRLTLFDVRRPPRPAAGDEALRKALPFLEDHPERNLRAARFDPRAVDTSWAAADLLPKSEIQFGGWGRWLGGQVQVYDFHPGRATALSHADHIDQDFRTRAQMLGPDELRADLDRYLAVSPRSPHVRFHLIGADWERAEGEAGAWEKEFAGHPAVLAALGQKYLDLARPVEAERLFRAAAKLSPENRCFLGIAEIYRVIRMDETKMLAVMEERLKYQNKTFEIARMRVLIAEVYSRRKDPATALRYAEKAAEETGAEWAIVPTIAYAERVGDRAKTALWRQRYRDGYGPQVGPGVVP
ncbi:secreted protein : Uncharacterized protein OS=Singulisphaera acidiphila (strain ATCC BAA-1392 / DSM 18658 / VKM B-2454 / MOB10) GN=Sinac_0893 PE=4 SV=1 [Gemmataceae bacterium]|nr:secreted protein : Uncharacterized protein OS=Singulisphaera acidiphila (strain ATCC BAA-1392 / DSM 18658 / VKM B-2454 / MOB10) GN=Sinac_0893 PE=4 SV=1 [Gemmataceae bacterium]VTU02471.1 secreted protein : Uncharacterized protein OS=Singulisphaera acidiphila (strain ATCC BAA-1392 / DSM 18658 / VKM B-2454 / MOB10) GN=Sinac_0893 PE=4 SV=1 [Gemmataceae bacterium]